MNVVGLTGGIATGKTTVSQFLTSLNIAIIDADVINQQLLKPQQQGYKIVLKLLPKTPLLQDFSLDKRYLRQTIFNNKSIKEELEAKLHPIIKAEILKQISALMSQAKTPYCVVAIPLLIEANFIDLVNEIWVCDCSEEEQIKRLMVRDNITLNDAKLIMSHQLMRQERLKFADEIIDTSHLESMKKQLLSLHQQQLLLHS